MKFQIILSLIISSITLRISKEGINLIKRHEKFYSKAYIVPFGDWKIGYGTTNSDYSITKTKITKGLEITEKKAHDWLVQTIDKIYGPKIMKLNRKYHWKQNQFDALCSYLYDNGSLEIITRNSKNSLKEIANYLNILSKTSSTKYEDKIKAKRRKDEYTLFIRGGL